MALEKTIEKEYQKIKDNAKIERDVVSYFNKLINSNYDKISSVFSPSIEKQFRENLKYMTKELSENGFDITKQEFFEDRLYAEIFNMIKELSDEAARPFGMTTYSYAVQTPDVQLGLSGYFEKTNILKGLTEKGVKEVNSYRDAAGLVSIKERRERLRKKSFFSV